MADKLMLIKRLRPIGMEFWPYHENPIEIDSAPKLWTSHRYITKKGYHYSVALIASDSILITLESVCPKTSITFKEVQLNIDDFVQELNKAFDKGNNFITLSVEFGFNDLSACDTCIRKNRACQSLNNSDATSAELKIYFSQKDMISALDYYRNHSNYKPNTSNVDKAVVEVSHPAVSSYNKKEKETKTMNDQNQMANQMTNLLGFNCGPTDNPNIAATALGICFRSPAGNWIKFNSETLQRIDMGTIQIGNLGPIWIIPSRTVEVGTPILYENEFYYVMDCSEEPKLKLLSVADGVEKTVYPAKNIFGFNFFAKVVALIDADNLIGGDGDDLLLVLALCGGMNGTGDQNNQNQLVNLLAMQSVLGEGKSGLLGEVSDSGIFGKLGGDDSLGKMLPLMALAGGLGNGNGQMAGLDMNTLVLMTALGKNGKKKSKVTKKEEPKEVEQPYQPTREDFQKMIQEAVAAQMKPVAQDTPASEEEGTNPPEN
ncbi:MAG: hypothetical protein Q4D02_03865 [Clostridia bacterium]|nr:hypothetical protein [Clostridia bacterium]